MSRDRCGGRWLDFFFLFKKPLEGVAIVVVVVVVVVVMAAIVIARIKTNISKVSFFLKAENTVTYLGLEMCCILSPCPHLLLLPLHSIIIITC